MLRAVARFCSAVLIGVGVTVAWQSYGDEAKEVVRTWVPSLGELLPASTMESAARTATLPEVLELLKPMSVDLAIVRRSLDQLAARQERIAQNLAALQEVEQDISQRISPLPLQAVQNPPRKPPSPVGPSPH